MSRSSLNILASRAIDLLVAVFEAQNQSVLQSRGLAMDETSLKAGRKMRTGRLWPMYVQPIDHKTIFRPDWSNFTNNRVLGYLIDFDEVVTEQEIDLDRCSEFTKWILNKEYIHGIYILK